MSHKFVLTLYLRFKQNTLRFDIIMTTQYVPHSMGYHLNTRCRLWHATRRILQRSRLEVRPG